MRPYTYFNTHTPSFVMLRIRSIVAVPRCGSIASGSARLIHRTIATTAPSQSPPSQLSCTGNKHTCSCTLSSRSAAPAPFFARNSTVAISSRLSSASTSSTNLRSFHSNTPIQHNSTALPDGKDVNVVFIDADGTRHPVVGKEGENLLALAHQNGVELEGACEASLACSTCHVILPDEYYSKLEPPVDEENDMLDLAFGLTDTSVNTPQDCRQSQLITQGAATNFLLVAHRRPVIDHVFLSPYYFLCFSSVLVSVVK